MSLRIRMSALLALAALCSLPLNNHSVLAADKDQPSEHGRLIKSIETKQKVTISRSDAADPNATLPDPRGGTVTWNVTSRLDLYENFYGGRSARCYVLASTSEPVWALYVREAAFFVDGTKVSAFANYGRENWYPTSYEWSTTNHYGLDGPSDFRCVGTNHTAQVTSSSTIYWTSTSANKIW